jgi:glucose-6-phosphate dehydrogenase assembly protein OpcA
MSELNVDSFLDGQGIPVELPGIEAELARLWGPAAEQVGGPEIEHPTVTRIVLANLVLERLDDRDPSIAAVLETVIARYPCRAIVICGAEKQPRQITAEVSALCHLPAPGMPQVCSERIVLRAGPESAALVPGAVRPLLEADLPMVLWWTSDPARNEALFRDLGDECSRLILELPDPGSTARAIELGLDPAICPFSRDSAWFGLARWRELVAQFFDCAGHLESLKRIRSVRVDALSPDASGPPRQAIWFAAWLAGQLGWKGMSVTNNKSGASAAKSRFTALFEADHGPVEIELATSSHQAEPRLMAVELNGGDGAQAEKFRLIRHAPESRSIRVETHSADRCSLPSIVESPELDPAQRIAAALESSRIDPPFRKARPIALWLIEQISASA